MRPPGRRSRKENDMMLLETGDIYPKSTPQQVYLERSMMKKCLSLGEIEGKMMIQQEIISSIVSEPTRLFPNLFVEPFSLVTIDNTSRSRVTCVKAKTSKDLWCIQVALYCYQSSLLGSKGIVSIPC